MTVIKISNGEAIKITCTKNVLMTYFYVQRGICHLWCRNREGGEESEVVVHKAVVDKTTLNSENLYIQAAIE